MPHPGPCSTVSFLDFSAAPLRFPFHVFTAHEVPLRPPIVSGRFISSIVRAASPDRPGRFFLPSFDPQAPIVSCRFFLPSFDLVVPFFYRSSPDLFWSFLSSIVRAASPDRPRVVSLFHRSSREPRSFLNVPVVLFFHLYEP